MYVQSFNLCNSGDIKYTRQYFTRGGKIFLAYLFITYIAPLVINLAYDSEPIFRLPINSEPILVSILLLILVSIFAIFAAKHTPTITPSYKGPIKPLPKWFIVIFSLAVISVGYSIFNAGLSQWRYTTSISSNSTVLYASLLQTIMPVISFWVLMTDHQFILSRSKSNILIKTLMFVGLVFSMNGFASMIAVLFFIFVFIAPQSMLGLLFNKSLAKKSNTKFLRYFGLLIILPIIIIPLIIAADFTKSGTNEDFSIREKALAATGLNYLINRHSIHLSSLAASIEDGPNLSTITLPINTSVFRFKIITGLDSAAEKPEVSTFSRAALLQFADYRNINPTGGSSPGFLASLTMVFPFTLTVVLVFFTTFFLIKLIDLILCRQPPLSFIGALIFAYMPFRMVTDSPFDLLIPGPIVIILMFIFFLSFRRERINYQ